MEEVGNLPWLVMNGATVWVAIVAGASAAGAWWAARAVPDARRRAREARKTGPEVRVSVASATAGERVALRGRLRVDVPIAEGGPFVRFGAVVAATFVADDAHASPAKGTGTTKAGTLVLETEDGARVPLLGEVEVVVGSTETRNALARREVETKVGGLLRAAAMPDPCRARAICEGDRVIATGVVTTVPRAVTTAYRAAAPAAALYGDGDATVTLVHDGTTRGTGPLGASTNGVVVHALLAGAIALVLLHTVGTATSRLGTPRALAVASATPFHRTRALETLRARVDLTGDPTPSRVREAATLEALLGRCGVGGALLVRHHLPNDAFQAMRACRDDRVLFGAWLELGEVDVASRWTRPAPGEPVDPWLVASVHLAAGDAARAGAAIRALAATAPRELAPELDCLASAAWRMSGVTSEPAPSPLHCPLEADDMTSRAPDLARTYAAAAASPWDPARTAYVMAVERTGGNVRYQGDAEVAGGHVILDARRAVSRVPPALLTSALAALDGKPGRRAAVHRATFELQLALVDAYFGDLESARRRAEAVLRECALRTAWAPPTYVDELERHHGTRPERVPFPSELPETFADDEKEAVRDAFRLADEAHVLQLALRVRDGAPLGELEHVRYQSSSAGLLFAILAWKTQGDAGGFLQVRAKLARHERHWRHLAQNDPFGLVADLEHDDDRGREVVDLLGGERGAHEPVARWLRTTYPSVTSRDVHTVQDVAEHLAARHVTARTVRAVDVVDATYPALAKLRRAFAVRETALLLAHLDELRHRAGPI